MHTSIYKLFIVFFLSLFSTQVFAQEQRAVIYGKVTDKATKEPLIGANIIIKGTSMGKSADLDGNFRIENIKTGEYSVEVSYVGYEKMLFTGIKLKPGEVRQLNVALGSSSVDLEKEVVIVGEKPLV